MMDDDVFAAALIITCWNARSKRSWRIYHNTRKENSKYLIVLLLSVQATKIRTKIRTSTQTFLNAE